MDLDDLRMYTNKFFSATDASNLCYNTLHELTPLYPNGNVEQPNIGNPLAWWRMTPNGTNTTQILDFAGTFNASNMPSVAGGPILITTNGAFYQFTGTNYFNVGSTSILPNTGDYTISAWIFFRGYPGATTIYSEDGDGNQSTKLAIESGSPVVTMFAYNGGYKNVTSSNTIAFDTWTHIAFTRSGTNGTLYINGVYNTNGVTQGTLATPRTHTTIGVQQYGASSFNAYAQNGDCLDDIRIFTNVLTATQIQSLADPSIIGRQ